MKNTILLTTLSLGMIASSQAAILADLTGVTADDTISSYLSVAYTGNVGVNTADAGGYSDAGFWSSSDQTHGAGATNTITFTVSGLATDEAISLSSVNFDFIPAFFSGTDVQLAVLTGTSAASLTTTAYDTGVISVTSNPETFAQSFAITDSLQNGDTLSFGFDFSNSFVNVARTQVVDNFVLNGDIVTVPEPSSAALLGLGSLALLARRKR